MSVNTLRFAFVGSCDRQARSTPFQGVKVPGSVLEYQAIFAVLAVMLAGGAAVVLHGLAVLGQ